MKFPWTFLNQRLLVKIFGRESIFLWKLKIGYHLLNNSEHISFIKPFWEPEQPSSLCIPPKVLHSYLNRILTSTWLRKPHLRGILEILHLISISTKRRSSTERFRHWTPINFLSAAILPSQAIFRIGINLWSKILCLLATACCPSLTCLSLTLTKESIQQKQKLNFCKLLTNIVLLRNAEGQFRINRNQRFKINRNQKFKINRNLRKLH